MSDLTKGDLLKFMTDLTIYMQNPALGMWRAENIGFEAMYGQKFIRIVQVGNGQRQVYCFLDFAGNIYKPDGWKKPAKHIRGTIHDPAIWKNGTIGAYGIRYLR